LSALFRKLRLAVPFSFQISQHSDRLGFLVVRKRPDQKDGVYNDWQTDQFLTSDVSPHGRHFRFPSYCRWLPWKCPRLEFRTARPALDHIVQYLAQIGQSREVGQPLIATLVL
jgi:hypothetical protein